MSVNNDQSFGSQKQPDRLCRMALVLGICSLILPIGIISLIISIIALVKVDSSAFPKFKRMASIGLITSLIGFVTAWFLLTRGVDMYREYCYTKQMAPSNCLSHAKQIALGMRMYADDNDDKFPLKENWQSAIKGYVKTDEVFICPSAKVPANSYAMHAERSGASRTKLPDLSKTVIGFESELPKSHAYGAFDAVAYRHADRASFMYADGHGKSVEHSQMPFIKPAPAKQ